ncbi:hypothetical protein CTM84_21045 [Photobacterium kishitanii]|nr:hypothetical protein CTM84_21045 [Photobacterium kishitanii]
MRKLILISLLFFTQLSYGDTLIFTGKIITPSCDVKLTYLQNKPIVKKSKCNQIIRTRIQHIDKENSPISNKKIITIQYI